VANGVDLTPTLLDYAGSPVPNLAAATLAGHEGYVGGRLAAMADLITLEEMAMPMSYMCLVAVLCGMVGADKEELLQNPDFEAGNEAWDSWSSHTDPVEAVPLSSDGRDVLYFEVFPDPLPEWGAPMSMITQYAQVAAGDVIEARFVMKAADASNGWGAMGAVGFQNAAGKEIATSRTGILSDGVWQRPMLEAEAPAGACRTRVSVEIQGQGRVWVDAVHLSVLRKAKSGPPAEPARVHYADNPVNAPFLGFGWEDDGFMYDAVQEAKGVTQEDLALRERRIRWLDPDIVRMQCWYGGWWPEGPSKPDAFTFDSDYMRSFCRTLDLYQELGAAVNITGVHWGMPVYTEPESATHAIGELFDELIKRRGYTCIQYWTLNNEPNDTVLNRAGLPFETLVAMYQGVEHEFERRRLNVRIIGSDDGNTMGLFERCVADPAYDATVDVYASHIYPQPHERVAIPRLIGDRLALLDGARPFILAEFGLKDARADAFGNKYMDTHDYALYAADLSIQAMNLGVSAMSIWTVQEMYYSKGKPPGRLMQYGLWAHKDRGWAVKPVYHAYGMFTRLTEPGDPVYAGVSTAPDWVRTTRIGNHLFLTNEAEQDVAVIVDGLRISALHVYDTSIELTDSECGRTITVDNGRFTMPPRSYAWGKVVPMMPRNS
jgi:hypothetical protein